MKTLVKSVTIKDCIVQTFRSGGKGGQNQNKRDTGVRVIHPPSGARGESREMREQFKNKQRAFKRMAETPEFQAWVKQVTGQQVAIEAAVNDQMRPVNIKAEALVDGKWIPIDPLTGSDD